MKNVLIIVYNLLQWFELSLSLSLFERIMIKIIRMIKSDQIIIEGNRNVICFLGFWWLGDE